MDNGEKELMQIAASMHRVLTLPYLEQTNDDELLKELNRLSVGITMRGYNLVDQLVHRARIGCFSTVSDLLYPPSHCVTTYGRFNRPGESVYYCSTGMGSCVAELNPEVGQLVSIMSSQFKSIDVIGIGLDLHSLIGSHPDDFRYALLVLLCYKRTI